MGISHALRRLEQDNAELWKQADTAILAREPDLENCRKIQAQIAGLKPALNALRQELLACTPFRVREPT